MFANPPYPCHTGCGRNLQISPPSISCTFEFDRSTPWTFYPTHLLTPHFQSLITVWPTISFFTFPSPRSFIITFAFSCIPYLPFCSPPIYPLTHTPHPWSPRSTSKLLLQTCPRKNLLLEIFATARDSFPFVASTAPGQDPLVAVCYFFLVVFARCLPFFVPLRYEAMDWLFLTCLVKARCVGSDAERRSRVSSLFFAGVRWFWFVVSKGFYFSL